MMNVTIEEIRRLISIQLGIRRVDAADHLRNDLGAESMDVQNIVMALEDKYGIIIDDEELPSINTVNDFHRLLVAKV